jgi:hypothetical protein
VNGAVGEPVSVGEADSLVGAAVSLPSSGDWHATIVMIDKVTKKATLPPGCSR